MSYLKHVKQMPFFSFLDGHKLEVCLWKSKHLICEFDGKGRCDESGYFYGTLDSREPKFCARHFYQEIVSGNGKTNYKLVDET